MKPMINKLFYLVLYFSSALFVLFGIFVICIQPYFLELILVDFTVLGVFSIVLGLLPIMYIYVFYMSGLVDNEKEVKYVKK